MNNELFIIILIAALAAFLGAGVGSYMAMRPSGVHIIQQTDDIHSQAKSALTSLHSEIERAARAIANFKIDVPPVQVPTPEINVHASISPWVAFWVFAATVSGIWLTNIFRKSVLGKRIETRIVRRTAGGFNDKEKRKRKRKA